LKALFLRWKALGEEHLEVEFELRGINTTCFTLDILSWDNYASEAISADIAKALMADDFCFAFSMNYIPVAAIACAACRIKYIAWVYDCPQDKLYQRSISLPTNHVFVFDRATYALAQKRGVKTIRHMPLGTAVSYYDSFPDLEEFRDKHSCDVSFVGRFYIEPGYDYYGYLGKLPDYTKGFNNALMKAQNGIYGDFFIEKALTDRVVADMAACYRFRELPGQTESLAWTYANYFLGLRVSCGERVELLSRLNGVGKVHLYTWDKDMVIDGCENLGPVDTIKEMAFVFKYSRINLNITIKPITTGIPGRVWDICGCGGFVITNYQEELLDFFTPGEDIIIYENPDDCRKKCEYYLKHPDERLKIARRGYELVKARHTYGHRLDAMLEIALN